MPSNKSEPFFSTDHFEVSLAWLELTWLRLDLQTLGFKTGCSIKKLLSNKFHTKNNLSDSVRRVPSFHKYISVIWLRSISCLKYTYFFMSWSILAVFANVLYLNINYKYFSRISVFLWSFCLKLLSVALTPSEICSIFYTKADV